MSDPASVRFRGPLTVHADGFRAELERERYTPLTAANLLRLAAHFSRWLEDHKFRLEDLSAGHVSSFFAHRRRHGYTGYLSSRALEPLIGYLGGIGVAIRPAAVIETAVDRVLREYQEYLVQDRCLTPSAIRQYVDSVRKFAGVYVDAESPQWDRLTPSDISDYVVHQARRSIAYGKNQGTYVRSLLRFLHVRGYVARDLSDGVPAVAGWRLAWVPKTLDSDQLDRLLSIDGRGSATACRDAAIVRLMVRLGLRAGDVSALELDDLDWRAGEILVCGKSKRHSRLPLPQDVGKELAAYLHRSRPAAATRKVFLRSRAPYRALSTTGVLAAVRSAFHHAGILTGGAHVLRHTAATQMLRRGASLSQIAHVLRHRSLDTTAIYAKVDYAALRTLVQPWPGGAV